MVDGLAIRMTSKRCYNRIRERPGMIKTCGQRVVAETPNILIVNVKLQAMTKKSSGWDGYWKNISENEVKKLGSLDVRLIIYVKFDTLENYNRSSFGTEDMNQLLTFSRSAGEWLGIWKMPTQRGTAVGVAWWHPLQSSWADWGTKIDILESAVGSKEDTAARWSHLWDAGGKPFSVWEIFMECGDLRNNELSIRARKQAESMLGKMLWAWALFLMTERAFLGT